MAAKQRLRWPKEPYVRKIKIESFTTECTRYSITRYSENGVAGNWHAEYRSEDYKLQGLGEYETVDGAKRACREHFKMLLKSNRQRKAVNSRR